MKNEINFLKNILFFVLLLFVMACMLALFGCELNHVTDKTYPVQCKAFLDCMYLNQRNNDKSVCLDLSRGCKNATYYILCSDKKDVPLRDCLLLLK